jgi:hypothetical protein
LDEVHSYCTEKRMNIFKMASARVMLGMSATTNDRADGFDSLYHKELAFDGIVHAENIDGFTYDDVIFTTEVSAIYYNGPNEYTKSLTHSSTGKIFVPYMIDQFIADPYRMKLLIREIRKLYDWSENGYMHCIYVFCEERQPLGLIYSELKKSFEGIEAPELLDVGQFIGGIKDAQITNLRNTARILLTTYGYSSTGISIDKMTAIVFATPRRTGMKQILARVLRRGGNLDIKRHIIDIIDNRTPLRYQYGDRAISYNFYNMAITTSKVRYDSI